MDRVILHTVVHHSSTSTYMPNFIEIEETFCGKTDGCTDGHLRPTSLGRLRRVELDSRPKNGRLASLALNPLVSVPALELWAKVC